MSLHYYYSQNINTGLASCQDNTTCKAALSGKCACAMLKEASRIQKIKSNKRYCFINMHPFHGNSL